MDDLVRQWNFRINGGIHIAPNFIFKTMLFADDQIVVSRTESELQRAVYELQKVCEKYNFKISLNKTKTMAFQGKYSVRTKIVLNDTPLEQVTSFKYLGTQLTYKHDSDCKYKLPIFQQLCGTINRNLKNKARKETQIKFYKVMAVPSLLFGSETWTMTAADSKKLQAAEMKFLRSVKGCTILDKIRNDKIREELMIFSLEEKIKNYRYQWAEHVNRMTPERIPRRMMDYRPRGRRHPGRPRKRWTDTL